MDGSGPPRDVLEAYSADLFVREDPLLADLRLEMVSRDLPMIQVPARTGLLLRILLRAAAARRVIEVGSLGGYSALWMARALPPGGRLTTLEIEPNHADLAEEFVQRAGLEEVVEVRRGDALELLRTLGPDGGTDAVFLDADKARYTSYLVEARRLLRPGGLLVADNAFWQGKILDEPRDDDPATAGIQAFNQAVAADPAFEGTILPVGDGVLIAVRR